MVVFKTKEFRFQPNRWSRARQVLCGSTSAGNLEDSSVGVFVNLSTTMVNVLDEAGHIRDNLSRNVQSLNKFFELSVFLEG